MHVDHRIIAPTLIAALGLVACGPTVVPVGEVMGSTAPSSEGDTTAPPPAPTGTTDGTADSSADTSGSDTTSAGSLDDTGPMTSAGFVDDADLGVGSSCSVWAQDCPAGLKCSWSSADGSGWEIQQCVPIVDDPDPVGSPCTIEGDTSSGLDTCPLGAMCVYESSSDPSSARCLPLCVGDESSPSCGTPDYTASIGGSGVCLCLPSCAPTIQDCPPGDGCYPIGELFTCATDDSERSGAPGSTCEFINVCDPGTFCANPVINTTVCLDQGVLGCCVPFCEIGGPACANGEACEPWYEDWGIPPGYENVGFCTTG